MKKVLLKLIMTILWLIASISVSADIILDGTLGQPGKLQGPHFEIAASLGQQQGPNLFHSFSQFDLYPGEIANFSGPNEIHNVISRVTGGQVSQINGLLRSTLPHADFYFLNPAGIFFGEKAQLDLQGAFHASTADLLSLGIDGQFTVNQPEQSILSVAPPNAFGFLSDKPAPISLENTILSVPTGKTLSLIGGELNLNGQLLSLYGQFPLFERAFSTQLLAAAGRINLASVTSKGTVMPTDSGLNFSADLQGGSITMENTEIKTSGQGGGSIFIRGGRFELINSEIEADTLGDQNGQLLSIQVDDLILQGEPTDSLKGFSAIASNTFGTGQGGQIALSVKQLQMKDNAYISTSTFGVGNAGKIFINVSDRLNFTGSWITDIAILSGIYSYSISPYPNAGQGGQIEIQAHQINLENGAQIGSGTLGSGNSGVVFIKVFDTLTASGMDVGFSSGIFADTQSIESNAGSAGRIEVEARQINLIDGGRIASATLGPGKGGAVFVNATDTLTILGKSGYEQLVLNSGISSRSDTTLPNAGNSGELIVQANTIHLKESGEITTSATTAAGGNMTIITPHLLYLHKGQITTSVAGGSGGGGNITIKTPLFVVLDHAQIIAQADEGQGGNIEMTSQQFISSTESVVSASSRLGIDGEVIINAPDTDVSGRVTVLPGEFLDATTLLKESCSAYLAAHANEEKKPSRFVALGLWGVPQYPEDWQGSHLVAKPISQPKEAQPALAAAQSVQKPLTVNTKKKPSPKFALLMGCDPKINHFSIQETNLTQLF